MKVYDISQEVFSCEVYTGDPIPEKNVLKSMQKGYARVLEAKRLAIKAKKNK